MKKLYRVLGDIAYSTGVDENGKPVHATAGKGEIVQLHDKDAAALCARGDVVFHADAPFEVTPASLPPPKE